MYYVGREKKQSQRSPSAAKEEQKDTPTLYMKTYLNICIYVSV